MGNGHLESGPYLTHDSLGHYEPTIQTASQIGSAVFAQVTAECPLYNGTLLSTKLAPSHGGSGAPSSTLFFGPIRAHNPTGITIGLAVFAQMTAKCPYTLQRDASFPTQN